MANLRLKLVCAAIALVVPAFALVQSRLSHANLSDSPRAIVDEAWQLLAREYVDRTFNNQDWQAVREEYLEQDYPSQNAAYLAINEMVKSLEDEYTRFLPPQALKDIVSNVSGEFIGVGVVVSLDPSTREWVVVKPFIDSPADVAGILPNDVITHVNGTKTSQINPSEAAPYLIGPVGSKLEIQVRRNQDQLSYELIREQINLNPLTFKSISSEAGNLGYIRLPVFTSKSPAAMEKAIKTLEQEGVDGYILDLRGNPGGVLDSGIAIARMWLNQGQIMSLILGTGEKEVYAADNTGLTLKPLQVLIDENSASASEVLAAAIQDNNRGTLVGQNTFGKGVVQSLEKLGNGAGLLITVAQYFTPTGEDIHKKGIAPDQEVENTIENPANSDELNVKQDEIYQKAVANLVEMTAN